MNEKLLAFTLTPDEYGAVIRALGAAMDYHREQANARPEYAKTFLADVDEWGRVYKKFRIQRIEQIETVKL